MPEVYGQSTLDPIILGDDFTYWPPLAAKLELVGALDYFGFGLSGSVGMVAAVESFEPVKISIHPEVSLRVRLLTLAMALR